VAVVLATWNVHGWVGADGARDPGRALDAIDGFGADVVALQEVQGTDWEALAEAAGYRVVIGLTGTLPFGNALLLRVPLVTIRRVDLSVPARERRGALDAVVELPSGPLRVVSTHFGLRASERRRQAARLAEHLDARSTDAPIALLGDFNDWTPWGRQIAPLARVVGRLSRIPTFPARRPVFPLDRAAFRGPRLAPRLRAVGSSTVRCASDHLPLRLELERR